MVQPLIDGQKAGEGSARQPVIAPDSARSVTKLKQVIGLTEGEIKGFGKDDIKLDGTPLSALSSEIIYDYRFGTVGQEYISGVDEVANEIGVGVELRGDLDWVKLITNTDIDHVGVRLRWGPLQTSHTNGDVSGAFIRYNIQIAPVNGIYETVLEASISDKTSDSYERYHEFKLPPSTEGWMLKVVRTTPSAQSTLISDKMYVQAYAEIIKSKFTFPYTSLIYLEYDARSFANVAKVAVNAKGMIIKVPSNYDPETRQYTGLWNGTFKMAYSNNPAWVYFDIVTQPRYGCGDRIDQSMVDKWSLYRLGQYCDQTVDDGYGGLEPRFTCNVYLQSKERAYDVLNRLTGLFRAFNFWNGSQLIVDADIPQDTSYLYTNANVVDGLFEYAGTAATDLYSAAKVAWDNPANGFNTEYEAVSYEHLIKKLGFKTLELDAWGCTSRGQALRAGRWALLAESDTVTFKVGMDGYLAMPGKIIEIQDEFYAGKSNGGRVISISQSGLEITLDRPVETIAGDTISFNTLAGTVKKCNIASSNGSVVTLTESVGSTIERMHIWAISSSQLATQKYRILTVKYDGIGEFTISAVEYNASKYEDIDSNITFDEPPTSIINPIAQVAVKNVTISSNEYVYQGLNTVNLEIKWERAENAVEYLVELKKDDATWLKLPPTGNNSIVLENVYAGYYIAKVTAVSAYELKSLPAYSVKTNVVGKLSMPLPPLNPRIVPIQFGVEFYWDFPQGATDTAVSRIIVSYLDPIGAVDDSGFLSYDKAYSDNKIVIQNLSLHTRVWFKVKLIDKLGFESPYTSWISGIPSQDYDKIMDLISGQIEQSDLYADLSQKIEIGVEANAAAANAQTSADQAATAASTANTVAANAQTSADQAATAAITANTAASNAQTAASNAQTTANTAKSTADQAKADITALTTSTNTTATELRNRLTTAETGLTQEKLDRASGDTAVVGQLNTYKSSNDAALAAVQQKAEAATTASTANATALTNLTSTVNTKNRTYRQTTAPTANRVIGDLWINTTAGKNNEVRRWNGTVWDDLTDPRTAASATALSTLQTTVTAIDGRTTANANSITQLRTDLTTLSNNVDAKADASAVDSLTTRVSTAEGNITSQGTRVTNLENSVNHATTGLSTKASSSALTAVDNKVTAANGRIDTTNSNVTTLAGRVSTVEGAVATKAEASALTALTTRVSNAEGVNTSQGSAITTLQNTVNHATTGLATKASTSALTATNSEVTRINGVVTGHTNQLTQLASDITTINGNLATKADASALNDIYTKTQADAKAQEIAAGKVAEYAANLVIGGVNQLINSEAEKTSTAASNREYLLYERSLHLKNFYNNNLGKDVTVSFEIKVPVAGVVQVYSSNGSAHTFSVSTPSLAADTWTKVVITVKPRLHSTTPDNVAGSTLEFYGTYSTGRIPTVRKVQLEAGNVATDWSPSPRDTQAALDANSTAIQNTNAEVSRVDGVATAANNATTALAGRVSTVEGAVATKAEAAALTSLTTRVTNAEGVNTSQGTAITTLQNTVNHATTGLATKASTSALTSLDTKVTNIDGRVTTNSSNITTLQGKVTTVENGLATKADVSAVNALTTRVGNVEGGLSTQASAITSLKSSIAGIAESITANGSQATVDAIGLPAANVLLSANTDSMTGSLVKLKGQVHAPVTNSKMLIDPTKLYKFRMRYRRTAGATNYLYIAIINYNATGDRTVTVSNGLNPVGTPISSTNYPISYELPALNLWREVEYYFKGKSTGASTGSGTLASPRTFPALAATVDIGILANYNKGSDLTQEYEIDYLIFEDATSEAANNVNAAAITSTNTEVSRIDGVVVAQGTSITNLQAGLTTANNNIATKADGSALTALTTRVTTAEGTITSQGTRVTSLENSVNNATTGLASKASSSALTTLNNQVQHSTTGLSAINTKVDNLKATVENPTSGLASKASSSALDTLSNKVNHSTTGLDALASKTTVLESNVSKALDVVTVKDTRSTNQPPSWYFTNYPSRVINEFKQTTAIGVTGFFGGTYCNLETKVYWTDPSGGDLIQTATSSVDPSLYVQRRSNGTAAWTAWVQPIKDLRDGLAGKASASAVESLTTRVSTAEGTISSEATKLSTLSTTVGGHTSSISTQQTSINGLNAKATIQVAAGNTIGGVALGNNGGNVEFIVRSNVFAVAPPVGTSGSNKYMMSYRSTAITLPNGTVVPAGLYLNNLVVDYIDASKIYATSLSAISADLGTIKVGSANIADAAITTAKIDNLAVTTAKIGDLQVDTIKVKDNAVTNGIAAQNTTSLTMVTDGGQVRVNVGIDYYRNRQQQFTDSLVLYRDGIEIKRWRFSGYWNSSSYVYEVRLNQELPMIVDIVGAGTHTYSLNGLGTTSMALLEVKK